MSKHKSGLFQRRNNLTHPIASVLRFSCTCVLFFYMLLSWGTASSPAAEPERWAIVVGIDGYFDLNPLTASSKDAIEFGEVLKERCGFKNVSVVTDKPKLADERAYLNVRCKPLQKRLRSFIETAEQSGVQTLVVYYSGHGCAVLTPNQRQPADLLLPAIDASESNGQLVNAISKNEIQGLLAKAKIPEKLLVLDCCHASRPDQIPVKGKAVILGPSSGKLIAKEATSGNDPTKAGVDFNFVVLAGSGFEQVAAEQVFTKDLIKGLSVIGVSAEDNDKSQWIEIDELFSFVKKSMSAAGGQRPSMELISGKLDGIKIAPSIFQPDPQRSITVYVGNDGNGVVSKANVKLLFFNNATSETETLASGMTNERGKANLNYHFGATRDLKGQFQIDVTPREQQYRSKVTGLRDFTSRPSGSVFKISLMKKDLKNSSSFAKAASPKFPAELSEPTHQEVITSIVEYVDSNSEVEDLCSFEKYFSDYHALMKGLKRSDKFRASGVTICFPSVSYWQQNDAFRAKALKILTARGVVNLALLAKRRTSSFLNMKEPSYNEVKKAAFGIIEKMNADVCGLVDFVDGYKELIDTLDKSEKYEVLPGLTVCFPSKDSWDTKPGFRKKFVRVLREAFVLTK